jgi:parallel beta-helix repeat protein
MRRDTRFASTRSAGLAAVLVAALAATASAGDGVIEINQELALAGGVTAGDTPGFPVTIDLPGSYRLTGSLVVPDENTTGILVQADYVTIDLSGFEISGPVTCTGDPVSCSPLGVGRGVSAFADYVTVRDGTVRGMGNAGIGLGGQGSSAIRVRAEQNGGVGIRLAIRGSAIECSVLRNGSAGLSGGGQSIISRNIVSRNRGHGVEVLSSDCLLVDNVILDNGNTGTGEGHGIDAATREGALIRRNTINGNAGSGIASEHATILENAVRGNGSQGLTLTAPVGYAGNVISQNGSTVAGGVEIGTNLCEGSTSCP